MTPNNEQFNNWRIASVMTRSAWLHIDEAFNIGKVKLYIGNYQKGQGAKAQAWGYVDLDTLRVILADLDRYGKLPATLYDDSKIEIFGGSVKAGEARVISFEYNEANNSPIIIKAAIGPGKRNKMGGIQPAGSMNGAAIFLSRFEARKLAAQTLATLAAWEAATVIQRRAVALGELGYNEFEETEQSYPKKGEARPDNGNAVKHELPQEKEAPNDKKRDQAKPDPQVDPDKSKPLVTQKKPKKKRAKRGRLGDIPQAPDKSPQAQRADVLRQHLTQAFPDESKRLKHISIGLEARNAAALDQLSMADLEQWIGFIVGKIAHRPVA